jgi:hypothetical protein
MIVGNVSFGCALEQSSEWLTSAADHDIESSNTSPPTDYRESQGRLHRGRPDFDGASLRQYGIGHGKIVRIYHRIRVQKTSEWIVIAKTDVLRRTIVEFVKNQDGWFMD